jgi:hypothetical protein
MSNDFKGDPREFAVVIPVPAVLQKDQIHVGEKALLDHLDAYSAPRLVEYFDEDPCSRRLYSKDMAAASPAAALRAGAASRAEAKSLGVTIEAQYTMVSTTSSSCPRCRAMDWKRGCARTVTGFPRARPVC